MTEKNQSEALAFERLPKWAQREIGNLRANLDYTQQRLDAALAAQELADTDDYAIVPTGQRAVRFRLTEERYPYIEVRTHEDRKGKPSLAVSCSEGLLVRPQAGNVILVAAEER